MESIQNKLGDPYIWLVLVFLGLILAINILFTVDFPMNHEVVVNEVAQVQDEAPAELNAPLEIVDMQTTVLYTTIDTLLGEPLPNFWNFTGASIDKIVQVDAVTGS